MATVASKKGFNRNFQSISQHGIHQNWNFLIDTYVLLFLQYISIIISLYHCIVKKGNYQVDKFYFYRLPMEKVFFGLQSKPNLLKLNVV